MAPRWRKALADIVARPGRAALAVLAMVVGVFALATLSFKQAILRPVLDSMYGSTRPASATLVVDTVDDALVEAVRAVPGVGDAEARPVIMARLRVGGDGKEEWIPALLHVVRDFDRQRLDVFKRDGGAWPPGDGEILLERSAVRVAGAARGADLVLRIPGGGEEALRFAGTVHAAGLAPAWMEHVVYGFIPWTSRVRAGAHRESAQLGIGVAEHALDEGHIREVAERVKAEIESRGHLVTRTDVPTPGRHPHAAQMDTFLYLVGSFALLAFLLSAVLVAGMIRAWQAEQVREVGMMKAIGATSRQIAGIYLAQVGALAAAALAVGVPLGWLVGRAYARFSAGILNADVSGSPFPFATLAVVVAAGLLVPLLAALVPVGLASRMSVHEALGDDLAARSPEAAGTGRVLSGMGWLPRPLVLTLRAALLRRGRLALTAGMLAVGGAMFMSALNVSEGWNRAVNDDYARRRFDLLVRLAGPRPVASLDAALATVPAVARAEYWAGASPYLVGPDGAAGSPVALLGIDPASGLLDLRMIAGRWLDGAAPDGVVINNAVQRLHPALGPGDTVALRLDGRTLAFPILGVAKELTPQPIVYAPRRAMLAATGQTGGEARTIRIVTRDRGDLAQRAAARELEGLLQREGIEVAALHRTADMKQGVLDHLVIIMVILTLAASVVVLVGAVGLASTLTINVVQRTREIGVLSAIGATPRAIAGLVWCEAVLTGALSWVAAVGLAAPVTAVLQTVTGRMFFRAPLDFTMSPGSAGIWLGLVAVVATLASLYPAWRAARLTVREAVTHV